VKALPIELQTGKTATRENILAEKPDHVILATGALRIAPKFPGKEQRHVFDGDELRGVLFGTNPKAAAKLNPIHRLMLTAARMTQMLRSIKLLRFMSKIWMPIAGEVVVIGGGLVGLELSEYLVERGRKVTILEPGTDLGPELAIVRRARVLHMLKEHGVEIHRGTHITNIGTDKVTYIQEDEEKSVPCKQVIIAIGAEADSSLEGQLSGSGTRVHRIGDCRDKSFIDGAILDARKLVQEI
jgi:2,4-dienoyl-CoA reductase (NADPH2)